jgi:hypothetical protein
MLIRIPPDGDFVDPTIVQVIASAPADDGAGKLCVFVNLSDGRTLNYHVPNASQASRLKNRIAEAVEAGLVQERMGLPAEH